MASKIVVKSRKLFVICVLGRLHFYNILKMHTLYYSIKNIYNSTDNTLRYYAVKCTVQIHVHATTCRICSIATTVCHHGSLRTCTLIIFSTCSNLEEVH